MKNLSLLSIATLLVIIPACVLSVNDDSTTGNDDVNDTATDTSTDTATESGSTEVGDTTTTDTSTTDETTVGDTTTTDTTDSTTGTVNMCGWDPNAMYYDCGFEGADPGGVAPIECPAGLVEGDPCATSGLTGEGCCDANGDNWYCAQGDVVAYVSCA